VVVQVVFLLDDNSEVVLGKINKKVAILIVSSYMILTVVFGQSKIRKYIDFYKS
jgi:hypothetical protein